MQELRLCARLFSRNKITRASLRRRSCESSQICRERSLSAHFFYSKCITRKYLTLKMKVEVTKYNIHNDAIRWRISTSVRAMWRIVLKALTVCEILTFQILYIEDLGQDHGEQYWQCCHSTENIYLNKSHWLHFFALALTVSEILKFQICDLENLVQGHRVQHSQWWNSVANTNF